MDPKTDQHGDGHAHGQPANIDKKDGLDFKEVSPGELEIVF
jgi:hypothetical protein